jgi:hypothetical protein
MPPPSPDPAVAKPPATGAAAPDEAPAPAPIVAAEPASAPPPPAEPAAFAPVQSGADEVIVTGSRIRRPNLESSVPITVVDSQTVGRRSVAAARSPGRRGDWNACTIEDPARSLAGCQVPAAAADGLQRAWTGDWDGARRAFDSALAAAPRSSAAYLNRGLLRRRSGELEAALGDLDRAVRYSPRSARYYYHRSLVLRQLGDPARAREDEARAIELDPRYAGVVPAPRAR